MAKLLEDLCALKECREEGLLSEAEYNFQRESVKKRCSAPDDVPHDASDNLEAAVQALTKVATALVGNVAAPAVQQRPSPSQSTSTHKTSPSPCTTTAEVSPAAGFDRKKWYHRRQPAVQELDWAEAGEDNCRDESRAHCRARRAAFKEEAKDALLQLQPMLVWLQQPWWSREPQEVQAPCTSWLWRWLDEFLGLLRHENAS